MIHSEVMFLEIMNIYGIFTNYAELDLDILKEAFYELQDIITNNLQTINFDFEEELDKLVSNYSSIFELTEDTLIIEGDINKACELLNEQLDGGLTKNDDCIAYLVQNINIYHILDIKDPTAQYEPFWMLNKSILAYHFLLAQKENLGKKINKDDLNGLLIYINQFKDMIREITGLDDILLRASLEFQKEKNPSDIDWYTALFDSHPFKNDILNHSLISYYLESDFLAIKNDDDIKDNYYTCYTDRDYFLSYFILILESLIPKLYNKGEIAKLLNVRKHLLIAITPPMEKAYLENGKLDGTLKPLIIEKTSKQAFLSFYPAVIERFKDLECPDIMLDTNKISNMILSAIFIRTFLDTCMHEEVLQNVYQMVKKAKFLHNNNYYYANLFTQLIIFSGDEPDIQKGR